MSETRPATPRARRPWRRRLLAVGLGLALTLVLLEGGLWIAYALLGSRERFEMGPLGEGERTILCIGDSNTYGIHLERRDSYPGQLQHFLDRWDANPWRVVNVGYPGHNSAEVRGRVAGHFAEYAPEIVICWVGVNNTWSFAGRHLWDTPDEERDPGLLERAIQGSRALGLARMVVNKAAALGGLSLERVMTPAKVRETLGIDWPRIQAICEEHGARLLMVNYPVHIEYTEDVVNSALEAVSARLGIPLVPLHDTVLPVVYGLGYERTMFADYHANEHGNYEVARRMLAALIEEGWLEARPEWTDVPPLWQVVSEWPIRVVDYDRRTATVLLSGPPGARYHLGLRRLYSNGGDKTQRGGLPLPEFDARPPAELRAGGFLGRLEDDGTKRLQLELPAEPTQHPAADGRPVVWLGWSLKLRMGVGDEELPLTERERRVDVLLDPAVFRDP